MKNLSLTLGGLALMVLSGVFTWAEVEVAPEKLQAFVEVAVALVGVAAAWYGRYRHGDITWYGRKKNK